MHRLVGSTPYGIVFSVVFVREYTIRHSLHVILTQRGSKNTLMWWLDRRHCIHRQLIPVVCLSACSPAGVEGLPIPPVKGNRKPLSGRWATRRETSEHQ